MWSQHPKIAKRWEKETPKGKKLPKYVRKKKSMKESILDIANTWLDEDYISEVDEDPRVTALVNSSKSNTSPKGKAPAQIKAALVQAKKDSETNSQVQTLHKKMETLKNDKEKQKIAYQIQDIITDLAKKKLGIKTVVDEDSAAAITTSSLGGNTDGVPDVKSAEFKAKWPYGEGSPMVKRNLPKKKKAKDVVDKFLKDYK